MKMLVAFFVRERMNFYRICCRSLHSTAVRSCSEIQVGSRYQSPSRTFSAVEVDQFARLSGDTNAIHLDDSFARRHSFDKRIVHGALINGFVSGILGTKLPGQGTVVVHQTLHFPNPLFVDEPFSALVQVKAAKMSVIVCTYRCVTRDGKTVFEGEAKVVMKKL